ncbi:MAG: CPBP family intramembrane metalloprotease [Actinobacteria bacterium]|nr:CPBP family intramembrane metalloprotease [Actinomycetota bacterium]
MPVAVLVLGVSAQVAVWRLVVRDRLPFWPATATTFAALGLASLLIGDPSCCREEEAAIAAGLGIASGVAFYGATRLVVGLATRFPLLDRAVADVYRRTQETTFPIAVALTLAIAVPGEELFWRGLVLPELQDATSTTTGAILTWAAAVGVNAAGASAPLLAGAVVGGALWTWLATWSGGVVASLASHLVWTGLMLSWPPLAGRAKVAA